MSDDARHEDPSEDGLQPPASRSEGDGDRAPGLDRLPPPAFPPGDRRSDAHRRAVAHSVRFMAAGKGGAGTESGSPAGESVPEDAFIDPDEPVVRAGTRIAEDAFIDPDEPIVRKAPPSKPEDFEEVLSRVSRAATEEEGETEEEDTLPAFESEDEDEMEVVVTGIGDNAHLEDEEELDAAETYGDPHVAALVEKVGKLADALRSKGEAGLRTTSEMGRFEATLRGYCVGYLAGKREAEDGS